MSSLRLPPTQDVYDSWRVSYLEKKIMVHMDGIMAHSSSGDLEKVSELMVMTKRYIPLPIPALIAILIVAVFTCVGEDYLGRL